MEFLKRFISKQKKADKYVASLNKNTAFCILPWVHLHALPGGNVYPCCNSAHQEKAIVGNLNENEKLSDTWNSDEIKSIRAKMLEGEKISICHKCYEQEAGGQESMRIASNETFKHHKNKVKKTSESGSFPFKGLPYLDIRFSNLCNLKCRICNHDYSTAWHKDTKLLNANYTKPLRIDVANNLDELWKELESYIEGLEFIQFAGGEPLMMQEHYRILKKLHELKKFDVKITYNTNLTLRYFKKHDIFDLWKDFDDVLVMASLDAMGPRAEYLRKNMKWQETENLRVQMLEICPNVRFRLDPTVSVHNILHLPNFIDDWISKNLINQEEVKINMLYEPEEYCVRNLSETNKQKVHENYKSKIKKLEQAELNSSNLIVQYHAVLDFMAVKGKEMESLFVDTSKKLDQIRKEKLEDVFPELKDSFNLNSSS
jgi:radical SAM protein with 4Fe4S-binding SPASM domain